MRACARRL